LEGSRYTVVSLWLWLSMKPGDTTNPVASRVSPACPGSIVPMAAMRPREMPISDRKPSRPVPSITRADLIKRSNIVVWKYEKEGQSSHKTNGSKFNRIFRHSELPTAMLSLQVNDHMFYNYIAGVSALGASVAGAGVDLRISPPLTRKNMIMPNTMVIAVVNHTRL